MKRFFFLLLASCATPGPAGEPGMTGPQGSIGPAGMPGGTGAAGANGNDGSTGAQGNTGAQGSNGADGSTGAPGNNGADGSTGNQGSTGATGPAADAIIGALVGAFTIDNTFDVARFAQVTSLTGDLRINSGLTNLSFPQLTHVGGRVLVDDNAALQSLNFPALTSVGGLRFKGGTTLTTVNLPVLADAGVITIDDQAAISTLAFPSLTTVAGLIITNNPALTSISLPLLASVSGSIDFHQDYNLTTLRFPVLTDAIHLEISYMGHLRGLSLPKLTSISGRLSIYNNDELRPCTADLVLSRLTSGPGISGTIGGNNGTPNSCRMLHCSNDSDVCATVPDQPNLTPDTGLTAEAWVRFHSTTSSTNILDKWDDNADESWLLVRVDDNGAASEHNKLVFLISDTAGAGSDAAVWSLAPLEDEQWYHVAGVWDLSEIRLYVNGVFQGSTPWIAAPFDNALPLRIGRPETPGQDVDIDEIRVSSIALYTQDFAPDLRLVPSGQTSELLHINNGPTLLDYSFNGNHGSLGGTGATVVDETL